jgi:thiol-disulfide isomerase/thioredoxin
MDTSIFHEGANVWCKVFITGTSDGGPRGKYPELFVPVLIQENGELCGSFVVPARATGIVAVFMDSLKLNVDNNRGEGYWAPVFAGPDLLPGSLSGIADLYAGGWPPTYHLEQRKDIARKLYEKDFSLHPGIKREFSRFYLATFDIHDAKDKALYKEELNRYSHYTDLDEWELLDVKKYYSLIGEVDSAKKYEKLVFDRYPNGSWALQVNSLKPAIQIDQEKDWIKQWAMYLEFKRTFSGVYPDEFTRKLMNDRLGQILRGMVVSFSDRNDLMTWEAEVNALDEPSRFFTYRRTAVFIAEKVKASFQMKGSGALERFKPESALWQSTASEEQLLVYAERLARESSDWYRKYMDAPKDVMNEIHLTDQEARSRRALQAALALDAWAQLLTLQQNQSGALEVLREAVRLCNYAEPGINEHFIELLVQTNNVEEARREASKVVGMSKSTPAIQEFYKVVVKDSTSRTSALKDVHKKLKEEMLHEVLPEVTLVDTNGRTVSLGDLKGKTIVLDFWATWCAPCIFGMEYMAAVVDRHKARNNVVFMFVNIERVDEDTKRRASSKLASLGYDFDLFFDPERRASKQLKVLAVPTLMVVDQKGKIRFRHTGIMMTRGKQQLIDELEAMIELTR